MGWALKGVALLLALVLLGAGAWQLSLLIFAVLFLPPFLRASRGRQPKAPKGGGIPRGRFPARDALGAVLLLLALVALLAHGTFSPLVFGSLGALVLLWGRLPRVGLGSALRPVEESILLASAPLRISWAAVAEVKLLARDAGRALAGVSGLVLVAVTERPSAYLVFERTALSERSAEEAVLESMKETALSLSALGAYLLPMDSHQASALLQPTLEASRAGDWSTTLSSGSYELVTITQEKGFARALAAYKRADQGKEGRARVPDPGRDLAHPPLVIEVFKALGSRMGSPQPDRYASFLSSLFATGGEPLGTRVMDAGGASLSEMVVRSQGSPPVELSRPQLRAVVKVYGKSG